ncbi:MAG: hypothetical protein LBR64_01295 [Dysgonamonadaceae bacterium]|jgi:hypothetical protein|nr:hypothetical protein [Dysgonamonadaceae bacterium]
MKYRITLFIALVCFAEWTNSIKNYTRNDYKAGINASLMRQYKTGKTYISENQIGRIENTLHLMGNELSAIKL